MDYHRKLLTLVELTKRLYNSLPILDNLIYIDGGEMVGTSTLLENIKNFDTFNECVYTREPSREVKKEIINKFGDRAFVDAKFVKDIVDMFMEDRHKNQFSLPLEKKNSTVIVSDRGIFSTIVYQSGILDPSTSVVDVVVNCNTIYESAVNRMIHLPKIAFMLCNTDGNFEADRIEFTRRLNKRIGNKEQELDALDNIADTMVINKVYSDLTAYVKEIPSIKCMDFKSNPSNIAMWAIKTIKETYYRE